MLHDDVTIPIDVTLEGAIYRLNTALANRTGNGIRYYNATVHPVPESEFNGQNLSSAHDYLLTDYDGNGVKDLMSNQDIYIADADASTREELLFSADDLEKAAVVASSRYKFYTDLARELIELSEQVARLSGQYCQYANQLGGNQIDSAKRASCQNSQQSSQADHLNLILTQSQLADSTKNKAYVYYWQRRETDAYDHTLAETLGNGLVNTYSHDANTGRPNYITTHKASVLFDPSIRQSTAKGRNVRFIQYRYDNHNNVTYRYDESLGITDTWQYDGLDRVVHNKVSLVSKDRHGVNNPDFAGPFEYQYDKLGNIKYKSDIGRYDYSGRNAGPHAVTKANGLHYQYDANGNMLRARIDGSAQNERELEWTAFNKPSKIVRNGKTVEFFYDANHNRYLKKNSDGIETFYFGKSYERITDSNTGVTQHKHFVYADGKLIALNTQSMDANNQLKDKQIRYLHHDALNSVDMITDGYGNVVERRSYDTWGKQRKVTWREEGPQDVVQSVITNRGYTGHEEIAEVGLVHMNGRVYDQELGRFISADPLVQSPYITNSFNRYSYVMNNPLKYIDPKGYWWSDSNGNGATGTCNTDGSETKPDRDKNDNNGSNPAPQEDLKGDGIGFTLGYIGRAIGSLIGGEGNTPPDQKKMRALTAKAKCRRGCGPKEFRAISAALDDPDVSFSNKTWNNLANSVSAGKVYNIAALDIVQSKAFQKELMTVAKNHLEVGIRVLQGVSGAVQTYAGSAMVAFGAVGCASGAGCIAGAGLMTLGSLLAAHGVNNVIEAIEGNGYMGPVKRAYVGVLGPTNGQYAYAAMDVALSVSGYSKMVADPTKFSLFYPDKVRTYSKSGIALGVPNDFNTAYQTYTMENE